MTLRRLFGGGPSEPDPKDDELAPRPPSADMNETETVRKIVDQLEDMPLEQRQFVAGFAYVLSRAANADLTFSDSEVAAIEAAVRAVSDLTEAQAVLVVEIARNQAELYGSTEDFLVTREFARVATREDREKLLRAAFAIGATDHTITSVESAELNEIGKELGFAPEEIDQIRVEYADQLSVVQAMRAQQAGATDEAPAS